MVLSKLITLSFNAFFCSYFQIIYFLNKENEILNNSKLNLNNKNIDVDQYNYDYSEYDQNIAENIKDIFSKHFSVKTPQTIQLLKV